MVTGGAFATSQLLIAALKLPSPVPPPPTWVHRKVSHFYSTVSSGIPIHEFLFKINKCTHLQKAEHCPIFSRHFRFPCIYLYSSHHNYRDSSIHSGSFSNWPNFLTHQLQPQCTSLISMKLSLLSTSLFSVSHQQSEKILKDWKYSELCILNYQHCIHPSLPQFDLNFHRQNTRNF